MREREREIEQEKEKGLLVVGMDFRGRVIASLDVALGPLACLAAALSLPASS